ncbi:hypothetical protein CLAIMM_01563 [Cladophialophora immunda]|nr:hypothetical protein CLAIMM_01563 [Cladophialophora immunda]
MANVDVIDPFHVSAVSNGEPNSHQYLAQTQPTPRLKEALVVAQESNPIEVLDAAASIEEAPNGETQPDQRPANILHEAYPKSNVQLPDHHIDDGRTLKVVIIGAGLSGILAGILLPVKVPKLELTILEKNDDVGGTWLENVYPGVRCDIPAHVYQSTFTPYTQWSQQFAEGHEILRYWQTQARKYDVYKYVKFGRRVQDVDWNDQNAQWTITGVNPKTGETFEEKADFVLPAIGRFNDWRLPSYPGVSDYRGHLRHTSNWDPSFDPTGKKIALIGNGASGIQVLPNLQPIADHIDHYARSRTWIAGSWAGDERTFAPQWYSEEQKKEFLDPEKYLKFRKELEDKYWRRFPSTFRGSEENLQMRERFIQIMAQRLVKKPELLDLLVPDFNPNCRRLTPGPGYLEALTADNVTLIQDPIKRFTATGIETVTGEHREVDAILCATGAAVDFVPPFNVRARGVNLREAWKPLSQDEKVDASHFGWPYTVEVQVTYFAKLLRKVSTQGIKAMWPSKRAADDFVAYADAFFPTTVLTDNCSSWANGARPGGRVHGIWPGSAGHVTLVRKEPRWEDWEYEYLHESGNRLIGWFGNGWTRKERDDHEDMTAYLQLEGTVDLRELHEKWWE